MWVYQFGYLDEFGYPVSTNYALDELRSFGDRPVWINPLWFWECHSDAPQGSARTRSPRLRMPRQAPSGSPCYGLAVGPIVGFPADTIEIPMKFVVAVVDCTTGKSAGFAPLRI
jgi:hypothetical protein